MYMIDRGGLAINTRGHPEIALYRSKISCTTYSAVHVIQVPIPHRSSRNYLLPFRIFHTGMRRQGKRNPAQLKGTHSSSVSPNTARFAT